MAGGWLDITEGGRTRRQALEPGLTRVATAGEIAYAAAGSDELHVWDQPPRAVYVGGGEPPRVAGAPLEEVSLVPGLRIEWRGLVLVYGGEAAPEHHAELEEIAVESPPPAPAAATPTAGLGPEEERVWNRLKAGMYVELGLADKVAAKRWQEAVVANTFDPDGCAREILARSAVTAGDPRILERSGRLLRDLLMAPVLRGARGASRRAREAARGTLAMVLSQGVAFVVYSTIVLLAMLLLRLRDVSFDALFDRILPGR